MSSTNADVRPEFLFLNRLRESGSVNMFGAWETLEVVFDLDQRTAKQVLVEWIGWANENDENLSR